MQTDYKNLKLAESLAVIFAALGISLVGAISFTALPAKNQTQVATALQVFDMHEQPSRQWREGFVFLAYDLPQDFLGKFYTAFNEVAVIPYETILSWQELGQDALDFSEQVAIAYQRNFLHENQTAIALAQEGEVAGASIVAEAPLLENIVPASIGRVKVADDLRGRGYEPPDIKKIFEQTLMLMEE